MSYRRGVPGVAAIAMVGILAGCGGGSSSSSHTSAVTSSTVSGGPTTSAPGTASSTVESGSAPDHVVIVIEENRAYDDIIGSKDAPYINSLAAQGASLTNAHGVTHPSQPNYLALFSGSTQGVTGDECPPRGSPYRAENLASALVATGKTFTGYAEDLPEAGSGVCTSGEYWRKHNPWVDFSNLPPELNQPFTAFPTDYSKLPTVSIVVPNQQHDMHSSTVQKADTWLQDNLDPYVQWAKRHNSVLLLTWDEDDYGSGNHIPTIFVGAGVRHGRVDQQVDHYDVLRTVEDLYGLTPIGKSASAEPIVRVFGG